MNEYNRLFLVTILFLTACKNGKFHEIIEPLDNGVKISTIMDSSESQIFRIKNDSEETIIGKQGTKIVIPKNCFINHQGYVTIKLIECYSIQDMICNDLSTKTTDNKILETDGMIYIQATNEKGNNLEIKPRETISVQMPTLKKKARMKLFSLDSDTRSWVLASEKNDKTTLDISIVYSPTEDTDNVACCDDSIIIKHKSEIIIDKNVKNENIATYIFQISKLGWINCDRFIEGETEDLYVNLQSANQEATLYIVLKNSNSILTNNSNLVDGKIKFKNIPKGPLTIVAFGMKDEDLYFNMVDYSSVGEINFPVLEKTTRKEMSNRLYDKFGKTIWERPNA